MRHLSMRVDSSSVSCIRAVDMTILGVERDRGWAQAQYDCIRMRRTVGMHDLSGSTSLSQLPSLEER